MSENKSRFSILPHDLDNICKIKVDGFLVSSCEIKKCDYLFIYKHGDVNKTFIFVELKGIDLHSAIKQIGNSIDLFYNEGLLSGINVRGGIVFTSYPRDNGTYRKLKRGLEQKYSSKLRSICIEQYSKCMLYDCLSDTFRQTK